jgi:hypothetical protein
MGAKLAWARSCFRWSRSILWVGAAVWLFNQGQTGWAIFMLVWGGGPDQRGRQYRQAVPDQPRQQFAVRTGVAGWRACIRLRRLVRRVHLARDRVQPGARLDCVRRRRQGITFARKLNVVFLGKNQIMFSQDSRGANDVRKMPLWLPLQLERVSRFYQRTRAPRQALGFQRSPSRWSSAESQASCRTAPCQVRRKG